MTDKITSIVTTREYAIWLASISQELEGIDRSVENTLKSFYLEQVLSNDIDLAHGVPLITPNEFSADIDTYREILQLIRQSFRQFAGRTSGKYAVIAAITQVNPLFFSRYKSGPRWVLGYQLVPDASLQEYSKNASSSLTNINTSGTFVLLTDYADSYTNIGSAGILYYYANFKRLGFTPPLGTLIPPLNHGIDLPLIYEMSNAKSIGEIIVKAGRYRAAIVSKHFPIALNIDTTNHIFLEFDNLGIIVDVLINLNGAVDGSGNLPIEEVINAFVASHPGYEPCRYVNSQLTFPLGNYVEVLSVSNGTNLTFSFVGTISSTGTTLSYQSPFDGSSGTPVTVVLNSVLTLYSQNGTDYINVYVGDVAPPTTTDTFGIANRYIGVASLIASLDQLKLESKNFHIYDGASSVIVHDGPSNAGVSENGDDYFDIPKIYADISGTLLISGATSLSIVSASDIDKFTSQGYFPFDVVVGRGPMQQTINFSLSDAGLGSDKYALFTAPSTWFDPGNDGTDYINIFIGNNIRDRNIGAHKLLYSTSATTAVISYCGIGASQPITITGMSVIGIDPKTINGSGTLSFIVAFTDVTWAAPGDSAGSAVNLSSDGWHRVFSNNGEYIDIAVYVSDLPGVDRADSISVGKFDVPITYSAGVNAATSWSFGEKVSIIYAVGAVWFLGSALKNTYRHNNSLRVYLDSDQLELKAYGRDSYGEIGVNVVNPTVAPIASISDTVTISGSALPNGWYPTSGTANVYIVPDSRYNKGGLFIGNNGVPDYTIKKTIPIDEKYSGFEVVLKTYIRNVTPVDNYALNFQIGLGFDTVSLSSPTLATISDPDDTIRYPKVIENTRIVPSGTTSVTIIITLVGPAGIPANFILEKVVLYSNKFHGLYLGENTIPRNDGRSKFGELLYIWSSDELASEETNVLGVDAPVSSGLILESHNVHEEIDAFDVTDIVSSNVNNVRGIINEIDFFTCTLINMEVVGRNPTRFSYVKPNILSFTQQDLIFTTSSPYTAILNIDSNETKLETIIYENDIPITNDTWQYNSKTEVEIISNFNSIAQYRIEYNTLIQIESTPIDIELPNNNGHETWLADYLIWNRNISNIGSVRDVVSITFNASFNAILPRRSDGEKLQSVLTEDTGIVKRIIPQSSWQYVDTLTINIDGSEFNPNAIYTFEYNQQIVDLDRAADVTAEIRSNSSIYLLGLSSYFPLMLNQYINASVRYHQLRITLNNISDLRDVRIHSLVLKGLNLTGAGSPPPGL